MTVRFFELYCMCTHALICKLGYCVATIFTYFIIQSSHVHTCTYVYLYICVFMYIWGDHILCSVWSYLHTATNVLGTSIHTVSSC